jgi:hypothetical protein
LFLAISSIDIFAEAYLGLAEKVIYHSFPETYQYHAAAGSAWDDDLQSMQNGHASVLRRDQHNHNGSPELNPCGLLKPTCNP